MRLQLVPKRTSFNYYPLQTYICLYYDTTLVLKRSGVLFADWGHMDVPEIRQLVMVLAPPCSRTRSLSSCSEMLTKL